MQILRRGSYGPQAELLQLALSRAGYLPAQGVDGIFGNATQAAVTRFQRDSGLAADGIAGPRTWSALEPWLLGYRTHMVRRGDTLYRIASAYGSSIRAIDIANPGIDPLNLRIGQYLIVPLGFDLVPTNISFTSTVMEYIVRGITARYPFINDGRMGYSVLGKPLYWLSIGNGSREVFYNASHHANEWITTPLLMKYLENYARAYAFGGNIGGRSAAELYRRTTLYLAPLVNPDGVDIAVNGIDITNPYHRKLISKVGIHSFNKVWQANVNGVDINHNYDAHWQVVKEYPSPGGYAGPYSESEPETKAIVDFVREEDFDILIAFHSQGGEIYYDFDGSMGKESERIVREMAQHSGYRAAIAEGTAAFGGCKDWFIKEFGKAGFTVEIGHGKNPLPEEMLNSIYEENAKIILCAMSEII